MHGNQIRDIRMSRNIAALLVLLLAAACSDGDNLADVCSESDSLSAACSDRKQNVSAAASDMKSIVDIFLRKKASYSKSFDVTATELNTIGNWYFIEKSDSAMAFMISTSIELPFKIQIDQLFRTIVRRSSEKECSFRFGSNGPAPIERIVSIHVEETALDVPVLLDYRNPRTDFDDTCEWDYNRTIIRIKDRKTDKQIESISIQPPESYDNHYRISRPYTEKPLPEFIEFSCPPEISPSTRPIGSCIRNLGDEYGAAFSIPESFIFEADRAALSQLQNIKKIHISVRALN